MLALNQTTGYAIMALGHLEDPGGEPMLVKDLARLTGIPKPYLSKMVHDLAGKGLIQTKRGYRGGVLLARPAKEISLVDIAEAVTGKAINFPCLLGLTTCSAEQACPLHEFWMEAVEVIHRSLRQTSLAEASEFHCMFGQSASPGSSMLAARPPTQATTPCQALLSSDRGCPAADPSRMSGIPKRRK
jgi:Rrf2 family transcriptional regulator, iron-sulfur cluster assembly transcription factor